MAKRRTPVKRTGPVKIERYEGTLEGLGKDTQEYLAEMKLAFKRIRETPEEQLRWVVNFIHEDLTRLRPEVISELGFDLKAIAHPEIFAEKGESAPIPEKEVLKLQKEIKDGLYGVMLGRSWDLPPGGKAVVRRLSEDGAKITKFDRVVSANDRIQIILGVASLLPEGGEKLRICQQCGNLLVARKRQIFCTPDHAQKARDARKRGEC